MTVKTIKTKFRAIDRQFNKWYSSQVGPSRNWPEQEAYLTKKFVEAKFFKTEKDVKSLWRALDILIQDVLPYCDDWKSQRKVIEQLLIWHSEYND